MHSKCSFNVTEWGQQSCGIKGISANCPASFRKDIRTTKGTWTQQVWNLRIIKNNITFMNMGRGILPPCCISLEMKLASGCSWPITSKVIARTRGLVVCVLLPDRRASCKIPLWSGWLFRQVFVAAAWRKCYLALPCFGGEALPSPMEGYSWLIQSSHQPSSSGAWRKAGSAGWGGSAWNRESSSGLFDWSFATLSTAGNGSGMTPGQGRDKMGKKWPHEISRRLLGWGSSFFTY